MTTEQETSLRIISLEAENVKRLKAVRIRPDKTVVMIEGKNEAGKSSVLDAIAAVGSLAGFRRSWPYPDARRPRTIPAASKPPTPMPIG